MKNIITFLIVIVGLSCNSQNINKPMDEIIITQTTVELIDGSGIGCENIFRDKYLLPDGSEKKGLTAGLFIFENDQRIVVGVGSQFQLNGTTYVVDKIKKNNLFRRYGEVHIHKI